MLFSPNSVWLRYVSWVRVALAATALGMSFLYPLKSPATFQILIVVFLGYTIVVAIRVKGLSGVMGLLAIFIDTIFFLVLASFGPERLIWMAAMFFLYLLTEALVFYTSLELVVIASVCAIFGAVLPYGPIRALQPTVLVAGTLACGFAIAQKRQNHRMAHLTERLLEVQKNADKAVEAERQRIASDFHDGPLQSFISVQMRLDILKK